MIRIDIKDVFINKAIWLIIILLCAGSVSMAQIVSSSSLRGLEEGRGVGEVLQLPTSRMATFDVDSARVAMEEASNDLRTYVFAHKLPLKIDIIKEGQRTILLDGTQVWRYRVRSTGAKSLSFLFDEFELPAGGLLYIYDSFRLENKIGGFGAINNNPNKVLPTMPIAAEDVVIEVQSPAGTSPMVRLSEVNHGVRDLDFLRLSIPRYDMGGPNSLACTPEIACLPTYADMGRGVVLIAIDGTAMGTGSLINNTQGDGRPLILTAAHVMSKNFGSPDVLNNTTNSIVFFNYASPTCSGEIAPNTVQTLAGGVLIGYQEKTDVALFVMNQRPPLEYNAYYSGWNAAPNPVGPFTNIHHPKAYSKRVNLHDATSLRIVSYPNSNLPFEANQHFEIPAWTIGTTASGSSGSPLFDADNKIVGGLSGGNSYCGVKKSDFFFSLQKLWERNDLESNKIINALDPSGSRQTECFGTKSKEVLDEPIRRISNITLSAEGNVRDQLPQMARDELLGSSSGVTMVGEYFKLRKDTKIHGLYLMVSTSFDAVNNLSGSESLEVVVYAEDGAKEIGRGAVKLKESFPLLKEKNSETLGGQVMSELFLEFPQPLFVPNDGGIIFGVKNSSIPEGISILHQQHQDAERGTLHHLVNGSWIKPKFSASLWLEPLISHRLIAEEANVQPLVRLENTPGFGVIITLATPDEQENKVDVFTLQGQRLYSADIRGGRHILPRAPFEGVGVVIIHVQVGKKKESFKVLFANGETK